MDLASELNISPAEVSMALERRGVAAVGFRRRP